jgi:protein SCO1/2
VFWEKLGAQLPLDSPLIDEAGGAVSLLDVTTQTPTLLVLGYYRCQKLCSVLRREIFETLGKSNLVAGRDYNLVFLSVDPKETPADAREAKAETLTGFSAPGAQSGWRFLTAREHESAAIAQAVGFDYAYDGKSLAHPLGIAVLTTRGVVSTYLFGLGVDTEAIQRALQRAASNEISAAASPVMLLCFNFDAMSGRYSLDIVKMLRIVSGGFAFVGAAFILRALRRERLS